MDKEKSLLLVISGPSGVGKGTVCKKLIEKLPNIKISTSVTTRKPRDGEIDGVHYFFKTKEEYSKLKNEDAFLETFEIFGNNYGTLKSIVGDLMNNGNDVLLEIDVQGGIDVKRKSKDAVLIFVIPPSLNELESRLRGRGTETEETFSRRFGEATKEINNYKFYDYVIKNDSVDAAVCDIINIIDVEKKKNFRCENMIMDLLGGKKV